jgi:hypothetical protein
MDCNFSTNVGKGSIQNLVEHFEGKRPLWYHKTSERCCMEPNWIGLPQDRVQQWCLLMAVARRKYLAEYMDYRLYRETCTTEVKRAIETSKKLSFISY